MKEYRQILAGLFVFWLVLGAYWHTCNIKYLCDVYPKTYLKQDTSREYTFYFQPNSNVFINDGNDYLGQLKIISKQIIINKHKKIFIEGHTHYTGTDLYRINLSQNRAQIVKDILVAEGVPEEIISIAVMSSNENLTHSQNIQNSKINRRAILKIID